MRSEVRIEDFLTPERVARERATQRIESPRGRLMIASCRSGVPIAREIIRRYETLLSDAGGDGPLLYLESIDDQFSDTETRVRLDRDVSGNDVFLIQALYDPRSGRSVDENYAAFLIGARALREYGANHVTAILPYLAYARQDKPTAFQREPTTAKLMADMSIEAGVRRFVVWHPHSSRIRGFYGGIPVDMISSLLLFAEEFRRFAGRDDVVVVAPDAGASKFVTYFSRALNLSSAIASKYRPRPEDASISELIGDFRGKRVALILDDMISSGGTMEALIEKLVEETEIREVHVGASHNLCTESAYDRLRSLHEKHHLVELVVTNSVPQTDVFLDLPFLSVRSLADTLSRIINRIHYNRSLSDLFYRLP